MTRRYWSDSDIEVLRRVYATTPTKLIAISLERPVAQVHAKANSLGLRKSPTLIAEEARRKMLEPGHGAIATQFRRGAVPANKGMRRPGYAPGNMASTQFRAGRPPEMAANYKPIGSLRVNDDGYLERKVTDDQRSVPARRWVAEHRLVWEAHNGPVPAGHVVVFKPGRRSADPALVTLDAVELITRAELMARNTIHHYPEPIKQVMRLRGQITRAIGDAEKKESK